MSSANRFARFTFAVAGIYGLAVTFPLYWMEDRISRETPPAITHAEYFYGFTGVVIAWQLVFLLIARDPVKRRNLMLVAILEKLGFAIPAIALYVQQRIADSVLGFGVIDVALAALFVASYLLTPPSERVAA